MPNNKSSRFLTVNGDELLRCRQALGWTQRELAKASGYTERLIRKAEKGGQLDPSTIQDLAEALSTKESRVTLESLTLDILAIARRWMEAFEALEVRMLPAIEPYLAEDFVFVCPGNPTTAPFIGTWKGVSGFQQWLDHFFGFLEREKATDVEYMKGEDSVIIRWLERGTHRGIPIGPIRINMHITFQNGRIIRMDDEYDTLAGEKTVALAKGTLEEQLPEV